MEWYPNFVALGVIFFHPLQSHFIHLVGNQLVDVFEYRIEEVVQRLALKSKSSVFILNMTRDGRPTL
jgi:hypothetical protein